MAVRIDPQAVREAVADQLGEARKLLCDLVAIPSPSGFEADAMKFVEQAFAPLADVRRAEMTNALKEDPEYQDFLANLDYTGRYNLVATYRPDGGWRRRPAARGRSLLLNAHVDTVPPSEGQPAPYLPEVRDGAVFGRGACDAKGQVATAWLALATLRRLKVELAGELSVHLVAEEELGGNGTLALLRGECGECVLPARVADVSPASLPSEALAEEGGEGVLPASGEGISPSAGASSEGPGAFDSSPSGRGCPEGTGEGAPAALADACVVLEPTDLRLLTASRGAVWFRIHLRGKPGHSGQAGHTRNAIDMSVRVIEILRHYHRELLAASRGDPLFDKYPNPMPLTIGSLHAGAWPAIAPGEAMLQGVLGFLPNRTAQDVMTEMTRRLALEGGDLLSGNFDIHFTYRHDACVLDVNHPLVSAVQSAARAVGCKAPVAAMTASCDAVFYQQLARVPVLVFGGGSLSVAHSNTEHMPLADLAAAAEVLACLAAQWCGQA